MFVILDGRDLHNQHSHSHGCVSVIAGLFLYSYEVDFIQGILKKNEKSHPDPLIFSSARNTFGDSVDHFYPIELEINDTTYTDRSILYLDP
jgi:hypothetical protein